MKNLFLSAAFSLAALAATAPASAQFAYTFSKTNQSYAPLSGATSVTKQKLWTADTSFAIPVGFNFKLAGSTLSTIYLSGGNFVSSSLTAVQSGFIMLGTGLMDRGTIQGISKSDIRYTTTGAAGSRIFKLEIFNAGFQDEFDNNGELKDSISMQLWLYEGSNITEFRYGPSRVSNFNDYFGSKMMAGYIQKIDTSTGVFEKFYVLDGTAASPSLDSLSSIFDDKGITSVPLSGSVYRFTPKGTTTGINQVTAGTLAKVYPTQCSNSLTIEQNTPGTLHYTILAMNGQVAAQGTAGNGRTSVDVSALSAGTYLVKIAGGDGRYEVQKIVRQ